MPHQFSAFVTSDEHQLQASEQLRIQTKHSDEFYKAGFLFLKPAREMDLFQGGGREWRQVSRVHNSHRYL